MLTRLETLAYYDTLDMPLKGEYLFDRAYLVPLHLRRAEFSERLWRKAMRALRWYRLVPFVQLVFVSGSLSVNNVDELSDVDIIIVARHGRIWLVRALTLALFQLLGVLRKHIHHTGHAPGKICPNHYITDRSLAIPFRTIYTAQLYSTLVPVVIHGSWNMEHFQRENKWVTEYFPWQWDMTKKLPSGWLYRVFEFLLGNHFEKICQRYQRKRIERNNVIPVPGGHLIYNDDMLAFHSGSSAGKIMEKYHESVKKLGV